MALSKTAQCAQRTYCVQSVIRGIDAGAPRKQTDALRCLRTRS